MLTMLDVPVTPVSERCDNKTRRVAQVLAAILDVCGDHAHNDIIFPVVAQLCQPAEVMWRTDLVFGHLCHHITG
jgi:hypothetical protein